jgi:hypothetical protein
MLIVIKIILVAFAVFGQAKLFQEHPSAAESSLDSLVLPEEKPELVLAQRAMEAQGLCPAEKAGRSAKAAVSAQDSAAVPEQREVSEHDLATNCF